MRCAFGLAVALLMVPSAAAQTADEDVAPPAAAPENDGTDPTRPVRIFSTNYEHLDLRGGVTADTLALAITEPLGGSHNSVRLRVPITAVSSAGNDRLAMGDIGARFNWIPEVNRRYGIVVQAEMIFDTAARAELGTGKNVFKGTFIYARFLRDGSIFAPALVHSESLWGQASRQPVRSTRLDLYFVPRLKNPHLFMTVDPAMTMDWQNERYFPSLAVTFGHKLGPMLGGRGQIFIKPSAAFFNQRPLNWSTEIAFQLLAF